MEGLLAAAVTTGWKWLAVLIAIGVLGLMELALFIFTGNANPWRLVKGKDGPPSTSKFQWLIWLAVVVFAYVVLWVLRARQGDYSAINDIPSNVLTVLGISTGTTALAKGIRAGQIRAAQKAAASGTAPPPPPPTPSQSGVLADDDGQPDIGKVQMIGFTFIAVGIFVATLIHQLASTPVTTTLPDIDSSLLVLMGISQGGYLGNKLFSGGS